MKFLMIAAAGLAATVALMPATAQMNQHERHVETTTTTTRTDSGADMRDHRYMRHHDRMRRVCTVSYRHHHKVRTCRTVRR